MDEKVSVAKMSLEKTRGLFRPLMTVETVVSVLLFIIILKTVNHFSDESYIKKHKTYYDHFYDSIDNFRFTFYYYGTFKVLGLCLLVIIAIIATTKWVKIRQGDQMGSAIGNRQVFAYFVRYLTGANAEQVESNQECDMFDPARLVQTTRKSVFVR